MPLTPSLAEVLEEGLYERSVGLHTALPGKFKSYDRETQTAEVIPVVKASHLAADGSRTETELPVIPNVKVHWPRAGGYYIHFPIAAGDYCQLIFNEASIALWRTTGKIASPGDLERHGLSHPYAVPGGWPDDDPITDAPADEGVIVVDAGKVLRVSRAGQDSDFVALKSAVDRIQEFIDNELVLNTAWAPTPPGAVNKLGPLDSSDALKAGK